MIQELLEEHFAKFTLEEWLKLFSEETWERLGFCMDRNDLKTYETTITQNLLFQVCRFQSLIQNSSIRLLEAKNEKVNGNDIEVFIQYGDEYLFFPVQAKSIYPSGKYQQIRHKTAGKHQINSLIDYAERRGGVPLYLLYNHYSKAKTKSISQKMDCKIKYLGCSLVNARYVFNNYFSSSEFALKGLPSFTDFHPEPAMPLFYLNKAINDGEILNRICGYDTNIKNSLRRYTKEEVFNEEDWLDLTPPPRISGIGIQEMHILKGTMNNELVYSPKYRLILSDKPDTSYLIYYG